MNLPHWLVGDAVALDELGNVIILDGNAHETISAHCGSQLVVKQPCLFCSVVCKILGKIWPNHCTDSWSNEKKMVLDAQGLPGEVS